eukprot:42870-Pyramimonas_sp.AAC.1
MKAQTHRLPDVHQLRKTFFEHADKDQRIWLVPRAKTPRRGERRRRGHPVDRELNLIVGHLSGERQDLQGGCTHAPIGLQRIAVTNRIKCRQNVLGSKYQRTIDPLISVRQALKQNCEDIIHGTTS